MKRYIQFYEMSTGHIAGSIPPEFGAPYPISASGSDGVFVPDQRLSLTNFHAIAKDMIIYRRNHKIRDFVGYSIEHSSRFNSPTGEIFRV